MKKSGLCSITFRQLSVKEVLKLAKQADLDGIEWGGDVHVPPGEFELAKKVANLTKSAGLDVVSYASYYRVGIENDVSFETILETSVNLKAPSIRVWAGRKGSDIADENYRKKVVKDTKRIADLAEKRNIIIHFEYHARTLTDTPESAVCLMEDINRSNVNLYWQPAVGKTVEERLDSIKKIKPWLSHIHTFHWEEITRLPFDKGLSEWEKYIDAINQSKSMEPKHRYFLMEFVKDDSTEQFLEDTKVLKILLEE